jgi:hypothetical protein
LLSRAHVTSLTHASSRPKLRIAAGPLPREGATFNPRGAMIDTLPLLEVNAISVPSGEYCGKLFMPGRSTIVRGSPPAAGTA